MTNFFQELKDLAVSRVKNTLLVSFIISWSIINYSVVLKLFFSKVTIEDKIEYLNNAVFEFEKDLFYPILIVLAHQFLIPYLNLFITQIKDKTISKWIREHKNINMKEHYQGLIDVETEKVNLKYIEKNIELELKKTEQEIEQNILRTKEEQLNTIKQINNADIKNTNTIEVQTDDKNEGFTSEDDKLLKNKTNLLDSDNDTKLTDMEEKILQALTGVSDNIGISISSIYNGIEGPIDEIRMHTDELIDEGYIKYTTSYDEHDMYILTKKGRKYLYNNNLLSH